MQSEPKSWVLLLFLLSQIGLGRQIHCTSISFVSCYLLSDFELYMKSLHLSLFSAYETLLPIFKFKWFD